MNPLYLGTSRRRLFAIHDAAAAALRPRAAVLCQPWGSEYVCAHRSVRHLALKLAEAGYHALRFDYFGSGDSGGEESEASLSGMQSDTEEAIEAVRDIADTLQVTLIGWRAGANVAAHVAADLADQVDRLVLCDPLLKSSEPHDQSSTPAAEAIADLWDAMKRRSCPSLILVTESQAAFEQLRGARDRAALDGVAVEFVPAPCTWVGSITTSGALPVAVFQRILTWLQ